MQFMKTNNPVKTMLKSVSNEFNQLPVPYGAEIHTS